MQASDLATKTDRLGGTNSTVYSLVNKYAAFSDWSRAITAEIMINQNFDFQGDYAFHDLVANQREYILPVGCLTIKRIDVCLNGVWHKCGILDASQLQDDYASEANIVAKFTNDLPYVDIMDNSFVIYSGTIQNVSGGIKITFGKEIVGEDNSGNDITDFTNDTDVSNLPLFAQMALVDGALIDYFTLNANDKMIARFNLRLWGNALGRPAVTENIGGLMRQILNYFSSKTPDEIGSVQSVYSEEDFN